MKNILVLLLPVLVVITITMGYNHGFIARSLILKERSNHGFFSQGISSRKSTALLSLGDPDTGGESTFYRWYVDMMKTKYLGVVFITKMSCQSS